MKDSWGGFSKGPDAVDGSGWELGEMAMASVIRTVMMLVRTLCIEGLCTASFCILCIPSAARVADSRAISRNPAARRTLNSSGRDKVG